MKEFYKAKCGIIVDNTVEYSKSYVVWKLREDPPSDVICDATQENSQGSLYKNFNNHNVSRWRKRPYIIIDDWPQLSDRIYLDKHHVQFKTEWSVMSQLTINEIMKNATAQDAIEYFKERGMFLCPLELDQK